MAGVAAIGLAVNLAIGLMLVRGSHANLNVRAAILHVAGDALGGGAVILGGLLIALTGAAWLDPALSLLVAGIIVAGVVGIVREATDVLLESAPGHAGIPAVRDRIAGVAGVVGRPRPARLDDRFGQPRALRARRARRPQAERGERHLALDRRRHAGRLRDRARHRAVRVRELRSRHDHRLHADGSGNRRRVREVVGDMKPGTVVLATARTPFGRLGGALASLAATSLGGDAIRNAIARAGIDPADVEHVIMGQVVQAGAGQAPARQAAFKAGLAKTTTAETINKVCASGMLAVAYGARCIGDGDHRVVVAGGMESMSNAPYLLPGARNGYRYGHGVLVDAMIHDGLWDYYFDEAMAAQGARVAAELGVTRAVQDEFAYQSHKRAHDAHEAGHFDAEIAPVNVATKLKGKIVVDALPQQARARIPAFAGAGGANGSVWDHVPPQNMVADPAQYSPYVTGDVPFTRVDRDEPVRRDASLDAMAKLKPIDKDGTITAGNAPGVNDGAAALVLSSAAYARSAGAEPLAEIVDHAGVAWDPPYLALVPAMAAQKLLDQQGLKASDIHVWEINEAFAAVALTAAARLGLDPTVVNAQGGAVALGHPIGASGARIVGAVVQQLRRRGGGLGIAAICSGGGQGDAVLVKVG